MRLRGYGVRSDDLRPAHANRFCDRLRSLYNLHHLFLLLFHFNRIGWALIRAEAAPLAVFIIWNEEFPLIFLDTTLWTDHFAETAFCTFLMMEFRLENPP
jgi:hypothetical protein